MNKTFGEVKLDRDSLAINYKDIQIGIDETANPYDYLILINHSAASLGSLRKNQKIITSTERAARLSKQGFTNVKGLKPGPMIQLTKGDGFLFVRAADNGYFLEFDNGRNIFLGSSQATGDSYRPFLYSLRDEGKEIHMGFFPGTLEESILAEIISLLQPNMAIVTGEAAPDHQGLGRLQKILRDQMYEGSLFSSRKEEKFPF